MVTSIAEAQIAATLVNMKFQEDVALWAAKECSDLDQAISMLQQECELCMNTYPMNQIVSMLKCTHKCCKQCAKSYFTVQVRINLIDIFQYRFVNINLITSFASVLKKLTAP